MLGVHKGVLYAIFSALVGLVGATTLAHNALSHNALTIAIIWYAASLAVNTIYLIVTKTFLSDCQEIKKHWKTMSILISIGILEGASWFYTLNLIGLSGTAITSRLSLVLITLYSIYALKETDDTIEKICMFIICMTSLSLFLDLGTGTQAWHYIIAFGAAIISFLYTVCLKHISQKSAPTAIHFFRAAGIFAIYAIIHTYLYETITPNLSGFTTSAIIFLAIGGICGGFICQYLRLRSFQFHCPLYIYKTITAAIPALSFLIGVHLIGEPSSPQKWIVAATVLSTSALITYRQYINNKKRA